MLLGRAKGFELAFAPTPENLKNGLVQTPERSLNWDRLSLRVWTEKGNHILDLQAPTKSSSKTVTLVVPELGCQQFSLPRTQGSLKTTYPPLACNNFGSNLSAQLRHLIQPFSQQITLAHPRPHLSPPSVNELGKNKLTKNKESRPFDYALSEKAIPNDLSNSSPQDW